MSTEKTKMLKGIAAGFSMALALMIVISLVVAKIKYPYILQSFKGVKQVYIALLGYGLFGNILLYALFWYLDKEYIQRGILLLTLSFSFIFIAYRYL